MSRRRNYLLPITLLLLFGLGAWIHVAIRSAAPLAPTDPSRPDYIVRTAHMIEMDGKGIPTRTLDASELRHYSQRDLTEADSPVMVVMDAGRESWRIRSASARVLHGNDEILLDGAVDIQHSETADAPPMHVVTRALRFLQNENYAETDQEALLESPGHRVEGVGLQAWLSEPVRVKLLHEVRGRHELD